MARAAAIVIQGNNVALIQRQRDGRLYHVFPGGGIEADETPEQAAVREVKEELGLDVIIESLVAKVFYRRNRETRTNQFYFRVRVLGGIFGTGTGPEMRGLYPPQSGTYHPVWMPIAQMEREVVHPKAIADMLLKTLNAGWPIAPIEFFEEI